MNSLKTAFIFILFILYFFIFTEEQSIAEESDVKTVTIDTSAVEGKLKAGIMIGYPLGITAGYRLADTFELNGFIGSNYYDFTLGCNGLFTVLNLKISHEKFPVSIGPALYSSFGHDDGNNKHGHDEYTKIDILGVGRIEYDFREIPLNLFAEAGLGLQLVRFADFTGSFAIGVRYIF